MSEKDIPKHYQRLLREFPDYMKAVNALGEAVQEVGPLHKPTTHLIQLVAAAAVHSESAVKSHTRRALESGATADQIRHALLLCTATLGFPIVQAALSWALEVIEA